jgi:hypothetical protein
MSRIRIASNFLNGSASVIAPKIMVMSDIVLEYLDDEGRSYGHNR